MKKIIVGIVAAFAGLLIVAATVSMIMGIINFVTYDEFLWLFLLLAPVVVGPPAKLLFNVCDKINGSED